MAYPSEDCWIVRIGTDSYAGNFERQMTAYATGLVGGCGVGRGLVDEEATEDFWDLALGVADEHGCYRPCAMGGDDCQDVLIFFCERPTPKMLKTIRQRATEYGLNISGRVGVEPIFVREFELLELKVEYTETIHPWEED